MVSQNRRQSKAALPLRIRPKLKSVSPINAKAELNPEPASRAALPTISKRDVDFLSPLPVLRSGTSSESAIKLSIPAGREERLTLTFCSLHQFSTRVTKTRRLVSHEPSLCMSNSSSETPDCLSNSSKIGSVFTRSPDRTIQSPLSSRTSLSSTRLRSASGVAVVFSKSVLSIRDRGTYRAEIACTQTLKTPARSLIPCKTLPNEFIEHWKTARCPRNCIFNRYSCLQRGRRYRISPG